jgi:hypothetical protein
VLERPADEDQRTELVALEPAEARDPEQPRRVQDPDVSHAHGLGVEAQRREPARGARQVLALVLGHVTNLPPLPNAT